MKRKYITEEERKAARKERQKKWREEHPDYQAEWRKNNKEKYAEYQAEWRKNNKEKKAEYYQNNKEKLAEYQATYRLTPEGRARILLGGYKQSDNLYNRGECTLTDDWIVQNIFSKPCHYCGRTDWHELGCDRKDSSLPHTPDNVVPCCNACNCKKGVTPYNEYMRLIGKIA